MLGNGMVTLHSFSTLSRIRRRRSLPLMPGV